MRLLKYALKSHSKGLRFSVRCSAFASRAAPCYRNGLLEQIWRGELRRKILLSSSGACQDWLCSKLWPKVEHIRWIGWSWQELRWSGSERALPWLWSNIFFCGIFWHILVNQPQLLVSEFENLKSCLVNKRIQLTY